MSTECRHEKKNTPLVFILFLMHCVFANAAYGQINQPVKWQFSARPISSTEAEIAFTANLDDGWHIYSQHLEEGGPLPTSFSFTPADDEYTRLGEVKEVSTPVKSYDNTFMMDIIWFAKTAVFTQKIKLKTATATVKGKIEFMVCTDEMCLPPDIIPFTVVATTGTDKSPLNKPAGEKLKSAPTPATSPKKSSHSSTTRHAAPLGHADTALIAAASTPTVVDTATVAQVTTATPSVSKENIATLQAARAKASQEETGNSEASFWSLFVAGFVGGLAAILMPCIFPMLPFTVSYFTKRSTNRRKAVGLAAVYGVSIIVLYVSLGMLITLIFGSDALNALATNGALNFLFFFLLLVFAASMLGAFEITLPSAWITHVDKRADQGGNAGIFFMAATLALASFSCTGPIIGTLLVSASRMNQWVGPVAGMLGFSAALALPFTLLAIFPAWLSALPKSGSWMNTVKVTLGFLELALALKFLSNVDLAYHWEWFDREVFLVLWIIIFGIMGLYLLGKVRLPHDTPSEHLSPQRLFVAIITLAFTLYMVPGLWGAPLKAVAAFLPPQQTQDFDLYSQTLMAAVKTESSTAQQLPKKYGDLFRAPYDLNVFFDYDEGLAYARQVNKPVMIDFTGHACVNCRKMETVVWSHPNVLSKLREDYVLIQLYVDDKTPLPEPEQTTSSFSNKPIVTIGNKWSDLQASSFNTNAQPYYVLLNNDGRQLGPATGAQYDINDFTTFLNEGLKVFHEKQKNIL